MKFAWSRLLVGALVAGAWLAPARAMAQADGELVVRKLTFEGNKAIDVFHLTRAGAKLSEPAQLALRNDLEQMLEGGL